MEAHTLRRSGCAKRRSDHLAAAGRAARRVLPVFDMSDDPEAAPRNSSSAAARVESPRMRHLLDCLQRVSNAPQDRYPRNTRYALLLVLGEFFTRGDSCIASEVALLESTGRLVSPGIRVLEYTARQGGCCGNGALKLRSRRQVEQTAVPYAPDREWFTLAITVTPTAPPKPKNGKPGRRRRPDRNQSQGNRTSPGSRNLTKPPRTGRIEQVRAASREGKTRDFTRTVRPPTKTFYYTFIVFPAGGYRHQIGESADEPDRQKNEVRHPRHADASLRGSWIVRSPLAGS